MAFLEEITRHRLLHGLLPTELVLLQEQLDALVAAYTAWLAATKPAELTRLGNKQEGYITLPASTLQDQY
jgi:predicted RNase H-like nuclease